MKPHHPGLFDMDDRLKALWAKGDNLERISTVVDFEAFWSELERGSAL